MGARAERELELKLRNTRAALINMLRDAEEDRRQLKEKAEELENKTRKLSQTRSAILNMLKDMAENKKKTENAYQELKRTQSQLIQSEKMATIGILAGGVAHEINNPLGGILIHTQMLLRKTRDRDERRSLKLIEESTRRCRDIVRSLLDYSRKPGLNDFRSLNLNKVISDACDMIHYEMEDRNIKIEAEYGSIPDIKGNSNELQQVFTNLILNAEDAIDETGKPGKIIIRTYQEDRYIISQVIDNSSGIPEENLKKIFDPFFTTKDVGKGTGLGLSIAYRIVEKHGGEINVASKLGEGTTFTIKLPVGENEGKDFGRG